MREVRVWLNGDDSVNIVTDVKLESLINTVNDYKHSHRFFTESTLEHFLTVKLGKLITVIPRDVEEINTLIQ